jgi:hypothetical protein
MTQPPPKEPTQTRRELASELVHSIMKDKSDERARERGQTQAQGKGTRQERTRRVLVFGLPAFLALLGWNLTRRPARGLTPTELDAGSRFKIFLAAQAFSTDRRAATVADAVGLGNEGLSRR